MQFFLEDNISEMPSLKQVQRLHSQVLVIAQLVVNSSTAHRVTGSTVYCESTVENMKLKILTFSSDQSRLQSVALSCLHEYIYLLMICFLYLQVVMKTCKYKGPF